MLLRKTIAAILTAATIAVLPLGARGADPQPNILFIITDQQRFDMLSCAGNRWVKTPNLDRLAAAGTRFELAYCAFPLCSPSRFAMFSGVMPSRIDMETNDVVPVPQELLDNAMGSVFRRAGYETVYGGKMHLPCRVRPQSAGYGFERNLTTNSRDTLAARCATYLWEKHDRPFLLVASFNNPHDICAMGHIAFAQSRPAKKKPKVKDDAETLACLEAAMKRPAGVSDEEFFSSGKYCPPMPANDAESPELADVMGTKGGMIAFEQSDWTDHDWQQHRWAYSRLTERVDAEIGVVLAALRKAKLEKETLVVFVSDHGEMDGSHRLGHKQFLFEEAIRVPLIISWPGHTRPGGVDREHMVSTGLDLIPTLCDFAGVPVPSQVTGRSLRPLAEGRPVSSWRRGLAIENRNGRAYLGADWKYVVFSPPKQEAKEAVINLAVDPGELHNAALGPDGAQRLAEGRAWLLHWYRAHREMLDDRYRIRWPAANSDRSDF